MHDDFYQMYLEELAQIQPCQAAEEAAILLAISQGDVSGKGRLIEGNLARALMYAKDYADKGLPMEDLVQEANVALTLSVDSYEDGDFQQYIKDQILEAIQAALDEQVNESKIEEEMLARVNVLKEVSQKMATDLGREATVEELAERMRMPVDEIRDIMKLTLEAMSVVGE